MIHLSCTQFLFLVCNRLYSLSLRGGAVAARRAHNPKVVGSSPTPATKIRKTVLNKEATSLFVFLRTFLMKPCQSTPIGTIN